MKEDIGKGNIYIKIIYKKSLLVSYILENIVTIIEGILNIKNLMRVDFYDFFF
jgi:hypothetical protein